MTTPGEPLQLPDVRPLVGGPVDSIEQLLNYGYRAAWRIRSRGRSFVVKADLRPGFQENEFRAHRHARDGGIRVAEIVGFYDRPVPTLMLAWLEGQSLRDTANPDSWREAGALLARTHALPLLRKSESSWSEFVTGWFGQELSALCEQGRLEPRESEAALAQAESLRDRLDRGTEAWLHGDCQPDHFLTTSRGMVLIDWADARPGDPVIDFAVLTMSSPMIEDVLAGYGASAELRRRTAELLPLYQAVRAAGAAVWLRRHGYGDSEESVELVRKFAKG